MKTLSWRTSGAAGSRCCCEAEFGVETELFLAFFTAVSSSMICVFQLHDTLVVQIGVCVCVWRGRQDLTWSLCSRLQVVMMSPSECPAVSWWQSSWTNSRKLHFPLVFCPFQFLFCCLPSFFSICSSITSSGSAQYSALPEGLSGQIFSSPSFSSLWRRQSGRRRRKQTKSEMQKKVFDVRDRH